MPTYIGTVTHEVFIGPNYRGQYTGFYYHNPVVISGSVNLGSGNSLNGGFAVNSVLAGAGLTNNGLIHGLNDTAAYYNGGTGVALLGSGSTLQNNGTIDGGSGGLYGVGGWAVEMYGGTLTNAHNISGGSGSNPNSSGGVGVSLDGGALINVSNSGGTTGGITGGRGYGYQYGNSARSYAGNGVIGTNATVENGNATISGTIKGGSGESGADGGVGLWLNGGSAMNSNGGSGSSIIGGTGFSGGGSGGIGVYLAGGATFINEATVAGGGSVGATGGEGVYAAHSSVINAVAGYISGGYSGTGASAAGVILGKYGQLTNGPFATIRSETGSGVGGVGVDLSGFGATAANTGIIKGGNATGTSAAGAGVDVTAGTALSNITLIAPYGAGNYSGRIYGGTSVSGPGGVGVYLNGGTLTTSGLIEGGRQNGVYADAVQFGPTTGSVMFLESGASFKGDITGFRIGDTIDITNVPFNTFEANGDLTFDATGLLITTSNDGTLQFTSSYAGETVQVTSDGSNPALGGTKITVACFLRGTRIRCEHGEVEIERLRIGDQVLTKSGQLRAIRWIGRRSYAAAVAAGAREVLPVLIRRGALGDGLPRRDLWVSPEHALWIDGLLIPAGALINGDSILQDESIAAVTYYHLEFDSHDVIYAEGAAAESFVDDESRLMFDNVAEYWSLYPQGPPQAARFCAPRVEEGPELECIRRGLPVRASVPLVTPWIPDRTEEPVSTLL